MLLCLALVGALAASPFLVAGVLKLQSELGLYRPRDGVEAFADAFPAIFIVGAAIAITFAWLAGPVK